MKTSRCLFLSAIVFVIGAYSAFWYYQANHIQKRLQDELNQLNGGGYGFTVQYDGMEKNGYPWDVQIGVLNPKIKGSKSQIGEKEQAIEVDVDGKIVDMFTLFGHRKGVELKGKTYLSLPQNGAMSAYKFLLKGEILGKINSLSPVDVKVVLSHLTFFDVTTGQEVPKINVDYASLDFERKELASSNQMIHCGIDVQGLDNSNLFIGEDGNQLQDLTLRLRQIFCSKIGKINFSTNFKMELPGKQKIDEIMASPLSLVIEKFPTITFDVDEYRMDGKYNSLGGKFHFKLKEDHNKNISVGVVFDLHAKTTDAYYQLLNESVDQLKKEVLATSGTTEEQKKLQEEQIGYLEIFKVNIPLIKRFNIDNVNVDWTVDVSKNEFDGKMVLSKLDLSNDSRGIYMHGQAQVQDKQAQGELIVDLHNYRQMVEDVVAYYNNILVVTTHMSKSTDVVLKVLSAGISGKIISYLKAISDVPTTESDDLKVTFSYKDGEEPKVGTLTWEAFQEYTTHLTADMLASSQPEDASQK